MKVLHANSYKYVGTSGRWHVFESVKLDFDPELLYLYRARFIKKDGTSVFFDPIRDTKFPEPCSYYTVRGKDSNGKQYCIPVEVECNDTSDCERKLARMANYVFRKEEIAEDDYSVKREVSC